MTILLAEDNPLTREALAAILETEGYSTVPAADGVEALRLWKERRPGLLCLDIMMPRMDGFEVCRRVRAAGSQAPILFLSAKNQEADVVAGLGFGADDFIRKPFTAGEVVARIKAALRRAPVVGEDQQAFEMGGLSVAPAALVARRAGGPAIPLTQREVSILRLLHRHTGVPVRRDHLLNECWGMDYFPDSRTLDQHILMLRRKVEMHPSRPRIIVTSRGAGYVFPG